MDDGGKTDEGGKGEYGEYGSNGSNGSMEGRRFFFLFLGRMVE